MNDLKFLPTYPCYLAACDAVCQPSGIFRLLAIRGQSGVIVPVFTEVEFVARCIEEAGKQDRLYLYTADTGPDLADILANARGTAEWVAFDPRGRGPLRYIFRLEYVIEQVRNNEGLYGHSS